MRRLCWIKNLSILGSVILPSILVGAPSQQHSKSSAVPHKPMVTISGISSGGMMTVQMLIAHSGLFNGAGIFAAGIYGCAEGSSQRALTNCMKEPQSLDTNRYVDMAQALQKIRQIDPLQLKGKPVFIVHGEKDTTILPDASLKLSEFLKHFGASVQRKVEAKMGHTFPTLNFGGSCETSHSPYVSNCSWAAVDTMFEMFGYKGAKSKVAPNLDIGFSPVKQSEYSSDSSILDDEGWIYIPKQCSKKSKCDLHVALHGCNQSPKLVQDTFRKYSGYREAADKYGVRILFPSAVASKNNPYGCWDWWGYTGDDYLSIRAPQIQALTRMIEKYR